MAHGLAQTVCPQCRSENPDGAEACFKCGRAFFALVQGSVLAGRYEILRPLGQGGMGRVYQARDRILDEKVAVKVLRPELTRDRELAARFRSEIKLARRVTHRNVCRIHEYSEDGGLRFISMEYVDGMNLRQYLRGRPVGAEDAFEISLQMGRGLEAVHELGILHRDFKAANIMIDARGVVKLMDFGIAKQLEGGGDHITTSGHVMGTPEYMSPEQARGGQVDLRSDLYALGCVVYEVFTGNALFQGDSAVTTLYKHLHEAPPLQTPGLPGPLMPVLGRVLAKLPSERFARVGDFLTALEVARGAAGFKDPGSRSLLLPLPVLPQLEPAHGSATSPFPSLLRGGPPSGAPLTSPTRALEPPPIDARTAPLAAVGVLVLGLVVAYALWPRPREAPTPSSTPVPTLALPSPEAAPASEPPSAAPSIAPVPTPAPIRTEHRPPTTPPRTQPTSSPRALAGPVVAASPLRPTPAPPSPTAAAATTGTLALLIVPPADVTVDGSGIGLVSSRELTLSPGRHVLSVAHPDYEPLQRVVRIRAGETERLMLDLAEKAIRK